LSLSQEDDLERELPASEQKIQKAREEGNVPRSRELGGGLVLLSAVGMLYVTGASFMEQSERLMRNGLMLGRNHAFDSKSMGLQWSSLLESSLWILLPLFVLVVLVGLGSNYAVGGFNWSTKALEPKFSKLDPIKGFANIFSTNGLVELTKAIVKTVLLSYVGYLLIKADLGHFTQLSALPLESAMKEAGSIIMFDTLILSVVYLGLVSVDVPYQLWKYYKGLRMNLEELKRESKESDGDPHLKGKIRSLQREAARKRMMASVPNADVVVTNPTHYSVALKYDKSGQGAPRVVAKGIGPLALKIREIAKENKIPTVEAPPLARALYTHVELEREIPNSLFTAVAKLLAYVYALAEGTAYQMELPDGSDIPAGMDPGPSP